MDHWGLKCIRASVLCDLNEFIPDNYYKDVTSRADRIAADVELVSKFHNAYNLNFTSRQLKAIDVLSFVVLLENTERTIYEIKPNVEKIKRAHSSIWQFKNNGTPLLNMLKTNQEKLESARESFICDLRTTLQEYVQFLPDNEARPILYFLENNTEQAPAGAKVEAEEQAGAKVEAEEQTGADDIPGKIPKIAIGKLAIKAAWQIEKETGKKATAQQVIEKLQILVETEPELIDTIPHGVIWVTSKGKDKSFDIGACEKTLYSWNDSRS